MESKVISNLFFFGFLKGQEDVDEAYSYLVILMGQLHLGVNSELSL